MPIPQTRGQSTKQNQNGTEYENPVRIQIRSQRFQNPIPVNKRIVQFSETDDVQHEIYYDTGIFKKEYNIKRSLGAKQFE